MELSELTKPYREICDNCHKEIIAYKDDNGLIKYQCPICGTKTVKKMISRNHYVKDIRRPRHFDYYDEN